MLGLSFKSVSNEGKWKRCSISQMEGNQFLEKNKTLE